MIPNDSLYDAPVYVLFLSRVGSVETRVVYSLDSGTENILMALWGLVVG